MESSARLKVRFRKCAGDLGDHKTVDVALTSCYPDIAVDLRKYEKQLRAKMIARALTAEPWGAKVARMVSQSLDTVPLSATDSKAFDKILVGLKELGVPAKQVETVSPERAGIELNKKVEPWWTVRLSAQGELQHKSVSGFGPLSDMLQATLVTRKWELPAPAREITWRYETKFLVLAGLFVHAGQAEKGWLKLADAALSGATVGAVGADGTVFVVRA